MDDTTKVFDEAISALNGRDLTKAEQRFRQVLNVDEAHVPALNLLTVVLMSLGRFSEAESFIAKAVHLDPASDVSWYNYGLISKQLSKLEQALAAFSAALDRNSKIAESWNNRGAVFSALGNFQAAVDDFDQAIALNPGYSEAYTNKGNALGQLSRHDEAVAAYDRALSINPDLSETWFGRGNVLADLRRYDDAIVAFDKALAIKPDLAEAWLGRGNAFYQLVRYEEALAAYEIALSFSPDLEGAWLGRGNAFANLKRYEDALAAYERVLLMPDLAGAWLGRGNVLADLKRYNEAFVAYDKALANNPDLAEAWLGRANAFAKQKRYEQALVDFDKSLSINSRLEGAWIGRANILWELKRHDEAISAYQTALTIAPGLAQAWLGIGNLLADLKCFEEAYAAYDKAFLLKHDIATAEGARLHAKMNCCIWSNVESEWDNLIGSIRSGRRNSVPLVFLTIDAAPEDLLQCADIWVKGHCEVVARKSPSASSNKAEKIRIGYLSADFRTHPVGYLSVGLFEHHDRSRFETFGFSIGPDDKSDLRGRIEKSFTSFIDLADKGDPEIVDTIASLNIDILVDLIGHTRGSRLPILGQRPASVLVNFLGYAGTVGGQLLDYIIADRTVIQDEETRYYSEKTVFLPHSFMPHDAARCKVATEALARIDHGLPEGEFVFCCFNNSYKITSRTFQSWMKILRTVDRSVLWLSDLPAIAKVNLRKEAGKCGIESTRLIFAKRVDSMEDHLARHRLADLFLDTLPYNAHSTASDALWSGLPVLTHIGRTFAGRVAASMLNALGLPELIASSQDEYEALAIELALNRDKLLKIKEKLDRHCLTMPLFDTALFTRHLETAYEAMHRQYQAGLPPDHIVIQAIPSPVWPPG